VVWKRGTYSIPSSDAYDNNTAPLGRSALVDDAITTLNSYRESKSEGRCPIGSLLRLPGPAQGQGFYAKVDVDVLFR
jgi:hypothetical protein